jgi:hypothetical protein
VQHDPFCPADSLRDGIDRGAREPSRKGPSSRISELYVIEAEVIRYALRHWQGLVPFLEDGRLELDTNTVERAIPPVALGRRNSSLAGSDGGVRHWAIVASLEATASPSGVESLVWLTDLLGRVVSGREGPRTRTAAATDLAGRAARACRRDLNTALVRRRSRPDRHPGRDRR